MELNQKISRDFVTWGNTLSEDTFQGSLIKIKMKRSLEKYPKRN